MTPRRMTSSALAILWIAIPLLLGGCGDADESETGEPSGITETTDPNTETWDLVWFSDSLGWSVADAWADLIEESEGVAVQVHDHASSNQSIEAVRDRILDDPETREELAGAEIVVVYGHPAKTAPRDMLRCVATSSSPRDPPAIATPADFRPYADVFREIYEEIFVLRAGRPTVIRTFDEYVGMVAGWRASGIEEECTAGWEAGNEAISEAAAEYGVLVARFYDEFNGVDHDEDAYEKGYIADDRRHASGEGILALAQVLHQLGYEPTAP